MVRVLQDLVEGDSAILQIRNKGNKMTISRRNLCGLIAAAALVTAPAIVARPAVAAETVVFAGWGGSIQAAQRKVLFNAFEKETGIKVIDVPDVSLAKIKTMVESGDVQWDVTQVLGMWVPLGEPDKLWEKMDYSVIKADAVPAALRSDYGIGNSAYGQVLAYNSEASGDAKAPTSWRDYWDVAGRPGPRALQDGPRYTLEFALLADGVAPKDLYPLDVDRAFASLDKIKKNISVWWKQAPQVPILLASSEVIMANSTHPRILGLVKEEKVPLKMVWSQSLMSVDWLSVPRGAKNAKNAMKLINFMTRADMQAALATETWIGPVNNDSLKLLTPEEQEGLPTYHYQKGEVVLFDNAWWAANNDKMLERWNSWKLK
ncbi:ABC transporter substrate-binding protein [Sinorhizobium meliloti]|nr:ABC transporter substrate-binding protein [Sinorhizobium meliloti]RVK62835.1 ABC transporter substrate-binding protein [Sinorhizobium meliloti]